ncbi:MAG: hypothetical protein WA746_06195, partial [Isosphaeraceae bacterium]
LPRPSRKCIACPPKRIFDRIVTVRDQTLRRVRGVSVVGRDIGEDQAPLRGTEDRPARALRQRDGTVNAPRR